MIRSKLEKGRGRRRRTTTPIAIGALASKVARTAAAKAVTAGYMVIRLNRQVGTVFHLHPLSPPRSPRSPRSLSPPERRSPFAHSTAIFRPRISAPSKSFWASSASRLSAYSTKAKPKNKKDLGPERSVVHVAVPRFTSHLVMVPNRLNLSSMSETRASRLRRPRPKL
jgi:hypothetical protein